ncbi:MAG: GNAT family N-acetyltransferase [Actinomycetota bacterium]|nr:GNAT family N-acetyltransferase [Actinomycetota bacterium]
MLGGRLVGAVPRAYGWSVEELPLDAPVVSQLWSQLQQQGSVDSPFLGLEWCSVLAQYRSARQRQSVLLASFHAEPVALLPIQFTHGPGGVRTLGIAGSGWLHPDHLDVVARTEHRAGGATAMLRHLMRERTWDMLDLDGLTASGGLAAALRAIVPPVALRLPERDIVAPYVDLRRRSFGDLFPSRNLRDQLRRGLRQAERTGGGFDVVTEPDEVVRHLEELMSLHNERFGVRSAVFATPERRQFHAEAVRRLGGPGVRIYRLVAEGVNAALLYALVHRRAVYYYSMGMRPSVGMSPGRTLLGHAIASAAQEGYDEFDLLRGDHAFKYRFASGHRTDRRVVAARFTPRGLLGAGAVVARSLHARHAAAA